MISVEQLPKHIARVVLKVPDLNPKNGNLSKFEVLAIVRPGWSNVGAYLPALPGGKIERIDFSPTIDAATFDDPLFIITLEQMILAGIEAVKREILEELGLTLATSLIHYIHSSTNAAGWTTHAYGANLPEKPLVVVQPDCAGVLWISEERILAGNPEMLDGHLDITKTGLKVLAQTSENL
jgi:8-oxo-dGTP pyrophosphatase MutT (NUDIX family)